MRHLLFLAALFTGSLSSCTHPAPVAPLPISDTLLFVMAGQSNMAGRGNIEAQDTVTDPRLLSLDTNNHFILAKEPISVRQGGLAGLDCGQRFGSTLLQNIAFRSSVGLITCAISSTSIEEWLGDSLHSVRLYTNMLSRARAGMRTGRLRGVLWHQGETNAEDSVKCRNYAQHLQAFILSFRNDVADPHLPFYIGRLAGWCRSPYKDSVNAGIEATAAALQDIYIIATDDLSPKADSIHFDAAGQREMGRRFAAQVLRHL